MIALMKTLALLLLLSAAGPAAASAGGGNPKAGYGGEDPAAALREAETAVRRGGAADAYAARGDAKRALGRPFEEFIVDYAEAARRDPQYNEKYQGLVEQRRSQLNVAEKKAPAVQADHDDNALAKILGSVAVGGLILIAAVVLLLGREKTV